MQELINSLSPKQRAVLFTALQTLQQSAGECKSHSIANGLNTMVTDSMNWLEKNAKDLQQQMFSHCFIDDLEPLDYFVEERKAEQERLKLEEQLPM